MIKGTLVKFVQKQKVNSKTQFVKDLIKLQQQVNKEQQEQKEEEIIHQDLNIRDNLSLFSPPPLPLLPLLSPSPLPILSNYGYDYNMGYDNTHSPNFLIYHHLDSSHINV